MLLLGEMASAQELLAQGVLHSVVEPADLDMVVANLCAQAAANAPLTTKVTKEAIRRLRNAQLPDIDDLIDLVYGSEDFKRGVRNFLQKNKQPPDWSGS